MGKAVKAQRPGPKPSGRWAVEAQALRRAMGSPAHGDKERALQDAMEEAGMDPDTPAQSARRRLAGLAFTEEFSRVHRLDCAVLQTSPLASIELIARWSAYDVRGAVAAAKKLMKGDYTVEALAGAEGRAREAKKPALSGRALDHAARGKILPWLKSALPGFSDADSEEDRGGPEQAGMSAQLRRKDGVDFLFVSGEETVAVMIFGPFRDHRLFRLRQAEFIQRLMGLSLYHDRVLAILPLEQRSLKCEEWLKERLSSKRRASGPIEFKYLDIGASDPLPDRDLERKAGRRSGGCARRR